MRSATELNNNKKKGSIWPRIDSFFILCESNYWHLRKILNLLSADSVSNFYVDELAGVRRFSCHLALDSKYTSTVSFDVSALNLPLTVSSPFSMAGRQEHQFVVRLYHDAKMAEVVSFQGCAAFLPEYFYPNKNMLQPDEKKQRNIFLGEWLSYCLAFGRVAGSVYAFESAP